MRPTTAVLLLGIALAVGCDEANPLRPRGTSLSFAVEGQAESKVCDSPATPQATCTVTITARVELGELEGKAWQIASVKGTVRDGRSGQDLQAVPGTLTSEDVRRVAGNNVLPANGRLTIPLELRFVVGQEPFYVDGPHELLVMVIASVLS